MPSLALDDRLIWFAHCPKAGGTSVERFMVERWGAAVGHLHWGWDLWWTGGGWRRADPPCSPQHLTWADAAPRLPRAPDAAFAVVRDPVARMLSEYRWQGHARRGTRAGRALARLPFSTWLGIMLGLAARNPYAFDNHLRPQADFVPPGARVFRLEDGLAPVGAWLAGTTGTAPPAALPHELGQGRGGAVVPCAQDLDVITKAFAADYARFGYALPDPGAAPSDPHARIRGRLVRAALPALAALERRGRL